MHVQTPLMTGRQMTCHRAEHYRNRGHRRHMGLGHLSGCLRVVGLRRHILAGSLALMAFPALAQTPQQFDLHCEGLRHWRDGTDSVDPISLHLRADLDANQWCEDQCTVTFQINEVSATFIKFRGTADLVFKDDNSDATPTKEEVFVSRTTGTYADSKWHPFERSYWTGGKCTVGPFSGFPESPSRLF